MVEDPWFELEHSTNQDSKQTDQDLTFNSNAEDTNELDNSLLENK